MVQLSFGRLRSFAPVQTHNDSRLIVRKGTVSQNLRFPVAARAGHPGFYFITGLRRSRGRMGAALVHADGNPVHGFVSVSHHGMGKYGISTLLVIHGAGSGGAIGGMIICGSARETCTHIVQVVRSLVWALWKLGRFMYKACMGFVEALVQRPLKGLYRFIIREAFDGHNNCQSEGNCGKRRMQRKKKHRQV